MRNRWTVIFILLALAGSGCGSSDTGPYDSNTEVPAGDPPFTPLGKSWVIDNAGVLSKDTIARCDAICQRLQNDAIAEMVVLVQNGVKHPADYATHYGRWLKLGRKGLSGDAGNNGIVWLVRPDADLKMTYSIGRGLPRLTSGHMANIMNAAKDYLHFANYDAGVLVLAQETDKTVRAIYGKQKGETK